MANTRVRSHYRAPSPTAQKQGTTAGKNGKSNGLLAAQTVVDKVRSYGWRGTGGTLVSIVFGVEEEEIVL